MKLKLTVLLLLLLGAGSVRAQQIVHVVSGVATLDVERNSKFKVILDQNITSVALAPSVGVPNLTAINVLFIQTGGTFTVTFGGNTSGTCTINNTGGTACQLQFDSASNTWFITGGASSGANPSGNNGDVQVKNGTSLGTGGLNDSGGVVSNSESFNQKGDVSCFQGPNPYVDARCYGVRAVNPNAAPAVSGINCTTTGGSPTITLSAASTFVNGDGIVCQNAGATSGLGTMSAPTVAPMNARGPIMSGDGVAASAGSTTYNYKIFACQVGGACTAASAAGSTSTGAASLGVQNQAGYSGTRSNDTWTYTVGSAPAFSQHTLVDVDTPTSGAVDADFQGYYKATTVSGTGFTMQPFGSAPGPPGDTRNGARSASVGTYTVHWWNYNKVTWVAPTGSPYRYYVCSDRATPGTYHLLGPAMRPNNPKFSGFNTDPQILEFDDFGATMTGPSASVVPWYVSDANCTGAATNDNWVTTIAGGAGTTTLTASGNAPNSNGGPLTIRFDNTPNLLAAVAASATATGQSPVALPFDINGNSYVFNSVVDIASSNPTLMLPQGLTANDTFLIGGGGGGGGKWYGDRLPGSPAGTIPKVVTKGLPGIFVVNGFNTTINNLQFTGPPNGITFMQDGGGGGAGSTYRDDAFFQAASNDYLGHAFLCRGVFGASCEATFFGKTFVNAGSQSMNGVSSAGAFYCDTCDALKFDEFYSTTRGIVAGNTNQVRIGYSHQNGGAMPFVFVTCKSGNCFTNLILGDSGGIELDTVGQPGITNIPGSGSVTTNAYWNNEVGPSSSIPLVSGQRLNSLYAVNIGFSAIGQNRDVCYVNNNLVIDGIFILSTNGTGTYFNSVCQTALSTGSNYSIFVGDVPMAAPTGVVVAGGSVPIGGHTYVVRPVWQNGGEGSRPPPSATITTSSGNQQVNLSWTPVAGNCKGYNIYRDGTALTTTSPLVPGCNSNSFSDTAAGASGIGLGGTNTGGGPSILAPGTQGIFAPLLSAPNLVGNGIPCTNAELVLSAGFGTTATVTAVAGTGQTCHWTLTSSGTGQAANPTITDTLTNPLPNASIVCEMRMEGGTGTATLINQTTLSATVPQFTFNGTPVAASTYIVVRRCGP